MPAASTWRRTAPSRTRSGCCSGTSRRSSRRTTAAPSSGSTTTSAEADQERLAGLAGPARPAAPRPDVGLPDAAARSRSRAPRRCSPRSTAGTTTGSALAGYKLLKADGIDRVRLLDLLRRLRATARTRPRGASRTGSRATPRSSGAGRGPRTGGCSTTAPRPIPTGKPWSERKQLRLVGRGAAEAGRAPTRPTSTRRSRPDYVPPDGAEGPDAIAGDHPFIMQADGRGWLYVPAGPRGRPAADALRAARVAVRATRSTRSARTRARQQHEPARGSVQPGRGRAGRRVYPYVVDDLPAHRAPHRRRHVALRAVPRRAAAGDVRRGASRARARARARARRLGDDRHGPLRDRGARARHRPHAPGDGRRDGRVHQVGLPYHWGSRGLTTGGAANDLTHMALDPNVHIQEVKALTCDIRPGRRPRGPRR